MEAEMYRDAAKGDHHVNVRLNELDWTMLGNEAIKRAIVQIAEQLAAQYVAEHGAEILAAISPQAVATNTMAAAGAAVNETLHKKWPDKVLVVEHQRAPEVWQRGVLGGLRRL